MSAPVAFRPRTNVELLDASVVFIRTHFATLAAVAALGQIPALVMNVLWPVSPSHPFEIWRVHPVLTAMRFVLLTLVYGAAGLMFVRVVDDLLHGRGADLGGALRRGVSRAVPATAGYLIKGIVVVLWMLLFLVPGIWAFARYFALFAAMEVEGLGPLAAIRRSKELARGNNGRVILVAGIPLLLVLILATIVQQTVVGMAGNPRMLGIAAAITTTLLAPFMTVPGILLYYDIRTRREGLDLDVAALAPSSSPSAAA